MTGVCIVMGTVCNKVVCTQSTVYHSVPKELSSTFHQVFCSQYKSEVNSFKLWSNQTQPIRNVTSANLTKFDAECQ